MTKRIVYKNNIFKFYDFQDDSCVLEINGTQYGFICIEDFIEDLDKFTFKILAKEIYNYIQDNIYFYGEEMEGFLA